MIEELGFLSSECDDSERRIIEAYSDLFQLSERLSKLFIILIREAEHDRGSAKNVMMNLLAVRSLELFQSSIVLLKKGCIPAAKITCRAFMENVYALCAIQLKDEAMGLYINQHKWTFLQKLQGNQKYMQKYPDRRIVPDIESKIATCKKDKHPKTAPKDWASLAKMDDFHNFYYQMLSDDIHANIESLNYYLNDNAAHIVSFGPSDKDLPFVADVCFRCMINATDKFALFLGANISNELSLLSTDNDALERKYRKD